MKESTPNKAQTDALRRFKAVSYLEDQLRLGHPLAQALRQASSTALAGRKRRLLPGPDLGRLVVRLPEGRL